MSRSLENYAFQRLGLGRSSLYHYLQVHDWLRDYHPASLERRPKGFIPEISDIGILVWIERRLRRPNVAEPLRKELEALRTKALAGKLTEREFREFRDRIRHKTEPLRVLLGRLRSIRRLAVAIPKVPAATIAAIEAAIRATEASLKAADKVVSIASVRRLRSATRGTLKRVRIGSNPRAPRERSRSPLRERRSSRTLRRFAGFRRAWRMTATLPRRAARLAPES